MDIAVLVLIVGLIVSATIAFLWAALQIKDLHQRPANNALPESIVQEVITPDFLNDIRTHILQELTRSLGVQSEQSRKHLADSLSHVHELVADELRRTVQKEFSNYQTSIANAKDLLVSTATKGQETIQQQQQTILQAYEHDLEMQKHAQMAMFEGRMADIITQYVLSAVGRETEGKDQLAQILRDLDDHKEQIMQDMRS